MPIYFISATNFNLLGIDEWCRNFKFINYIDCYDGRHPNTFVPTERAHPEFDSIEDINAYLLEHKEVIDLIKSRGKKPKAAFLMFDERIEKICKETGDRGLVPQGETSRTDRPQDRNGAHRQQGRRAERAQRAQ